MIAALSFNRPALGSGGTYPVPGSYGVSFGGERLYDAWGGVRAGQSHGYPNHRYCANLGHIADDETGLTYMRARYYEPSTGRFISEDPAMDGRNWYVYCWNDPVESVDPSGMYKSRHAWSWGQITGYMLAFAALTVGTVSQTLKGNPTDPVKAKTAAASMLAMSAGAFAFALSFGTDAPGAAFIIAFAGAVAAAARFGPSFLGLVEASERTKNSVANIAVIATSIHIVMIIGALIATGPVE